MPNEASKTRAVWGQEVLALLRGDGLDVGCGDDPILPGVEPFDKPQGDANHLSRYVTRTYDFVFASHVLEHMHDPGAALRDWLSVVKPGGHLIALVPDEDLYEQGHFPSLFNDDHKHTFTLRKARSWSPRSVNVLDLVKDLDATLISAELQDQGYDRRLLRHTPTRHRLRLLTLWRRIGRRLRPGLLRTLVNRLFIALGAPVDQTALPDARLAQIQFILRRHADTRPKGTG
jgi:SAM-dependent methyltransferase